jgi:hypothetical protein
VKQAYHAVDESRPPFPDPLLLLALYALLMVVVLLW